MEEKFVTAYNGLTPEQQRIVCDLILSLARQEHPLPEWIPLREAARILNVSVPTARAKMNEGILKGKKISERKVYVRSDDVDLLRKKQLGL